MSTFRNETFTELMRTQGFRKAFEYRLEHLGTPIPEEHLTEEEKEALNKTTEEVVSTETSVSSETTPLPTNEAPETTEEVVETSEGAEKAEYTVDEVKAKLTEAGVKFHHMDGPAKIMELAVANNLI